MQRSLFFPGKSNLLQLFSQLDMIMYLGILLSGKIHCLLLRAETPQWCLGRVRCLSPGFTKATPLSRKQPGSQLKPLPRPCVGCRLTSQVRMLSPQPPLVGGDHNGPYSLNVAGWRDSNRASISFPQGSWSNYLKYRRCRLLPLSSRQHLVWSVRSQVYIYRSQVYIYIYIKVGYCHFFWWRLLQFV